MAIRTGRKKKLCPEVEYFLTSVSSAALDSRFVSIRMVLGRLCGFDRTICKPVRGDPPPIPRFLTRKVAKYSSLIRAVRELPSRTTSGVGSLRYRLSAIRAPSRAVVAGACIPAGNEGAVTAQIIKAPAAARQHFTSHLTLDVSIMQ